MVIRFPNPGGTAALMTREAVDHAFGRQQTLVDRARDATRGMAGAQPRIVLDDGTVRVKARWVYRIDAGHVFWNPVNGLGTTPGMRRYEDPRCFIRLHDWLPSTEEWYQASMVSCPPCRTPGRTCAGQRQSTGRRRMIP